VVGEWPWEAVVATGLSLAGAAAAGARALWRWLLKAEQAEVDIHTQGWAEVEKRDHQIELLRRVLDRSRRRESGYATALELALLAMKLPPGEQAGVVARIREILKATLGGSGAGGA
jgi:hypothetical protein